MTIQKNEPWRKNDCEYGKGESLIWSFTLEASIGRVDVGCCWLLLIADGCYCNRIAADFVFESSLWYERFCTILKVIEAELHFFCWTDPCKLNFAKCLFYWIFIKHQLIRTDITYLWNPYWHKVRKWTFFLLLNTLKNYLQILRLNGVPVTPIRAGVKHLLTIGMVGVFSITPFFTFSGAEKQYFFQTWAKPKVVLLSMEPQF